MQPKITAAQQRILQSMKDGKELYELLSFTNDKPDYRSGTLNNPNTYRVSQEHVRTATIDVLLRQKLIVEDKRWVASTGSRPEGPYVCWHIEYKLAENGQAKQSA